MDGGHILQEGTPEEIYERPTSRFVADFIGQTNFFEGRIEEVGPAVSVRTDDRLVLRCPVEPWASVGQLVSVAVRPEKITPLATRGNGAGTNRVTGTLVRRNYLGDLVQFHVMLPGGREVIWQGHGGEAEPPQLGTSMELGWDVGSTLLIGEEREDRLAQEDDLRLLADDTGGEGEPSLPERRG
jgi:ABC-type Fe3+/spermidine/putrescine transport system ATPase subunit